MEMNHAQRVAQISRQVKGFYDAGQSFRIYHGTTNSTRVLTFDRDRMVDVSGLNNVLDIDTNKRIAFVEANVPMDMLVEAALRHGLMPAVVPEFPGITVAGAIQGGAGESSSFKWGTFNRIVRRYEMILATGELVQLSAQEDEDLFWGAAGSYGSLGVVTAAEVQLIPAKKYVEVDYIPVESFAEAQAQITQQNSKRPDFIDGIMFSAKSGVILVGRLSDKTSRKITSFSGVFDEWFYIHAQKAVTAGKVVAGAMEIRDYLFRYDRGAFWTGRAAFERVGVPFNRFMRSLLDPLMHTRKMYEALQASGVSQEFIIQDLALPDDRVVEFLTFVDRELAIYPLWLCPLLPDDSSPLLSSAISAKSIMNVGVWGFWSRNFDDVVDINRRLEAKVGELGGRKWLYAQSFYTEDEFWDIYDEGWYRRIRSKYHAEGLPSVYEKTSSGSHRYPVSAKRGVLFALMGRHGIRIRK